MRKNQMLTPYDGCQNFGWCKRYGCMVWNDESREKFQRTEKLSKKIDAEIDELVKLGQDVWR